MGSDPNDINAWLDDDLARLEQEGGAKRVIADNYRKFWNYFGSHMATAELLINEALDIARTTGELRWELHLRHWRLQLWITGSRVKEMLPEAIDLLSLAVDERVKDVPQRICAYNDVVACYILMDPAGYYKEIKENSEYILGQLPRSHHCADCTRGNMALAAAASGRTTEAERWLAEHESYRYGNRHSGLLFFRAGAYISLQQWDEAARHYLEACEVTRRENRSGSHMEALIGVAHARLGKGDIPGAQKMLRRARREAKNQGGTDNTAYLQEVEGYLAEAHKLPQTAIGYFTRAAQVYHEQERYRDAARLALRAAELASSHNLPDPEEALDIAARAVAMLPPASQYLYQRLASLGREPSAAKTEGNML